VSDALFQVATLWGRHVPTSVLDIVIINTPVSNKMTAIELTSVTEEDKSPAIMKKGSITLTAKIHRANFRYETLYMID
jgi:hypothetical protein